VPIGDCALDRSRVEPVIPHTPLEWCAPHKLSQPFGPTAMYEIWHHQAFLYRAMDASLRRIRLVFHS